MKAFLTISLLALCFPLILTLLTIGRPVDLLEIGDVANIVLPLMTLPLMAKPVWKSLRGTACDNYDRFIAAVFFINLGIEVQMIWRLWDRIAGTSTTFRDSVIVYSLALFALGGVLQILAFDGDRSVPVKDTVMKLGVVFILSFLASTAAIWVTHS